MMRNIVILIVALLVLPWGAATAQKTYKWIDSQGNVSYHDRAPPANSGYRVEEKQMGSKRERATDEAEDAAQKFPVVLYSVPKCSSCDAARAYLQKRKVPFSEKNVEKDVKLQDELKAKAGALSVPTILIGSKVMNGYLESLLEGELNQAGYSKAETEKSDEKPAGDEQFKAPTQ
jgi:glutaredoxin